MGTQWVYPRTIASDSNRLKPLSANGAATGQCGDTLPQPVETHFEVTSRPRSEGFLDTPLEGVEETTPVVCRKV